MAARGLRPLLLAAALAAAQLAVVGPLAVWADNRDSFAGLSGAAVGTLAGAGVLLTAVFLLPGLLVRRFAKPLSAALGALTLLMWGQSFLSGRLLTGTRIAGSTSAAQQAAESLVWATVLLAALLFATRLLGPLLRVACLVVAIQALAVGWTVATAQPERLGVGADRDESLDRLAALSSTRNIIVLVLDGTHRDFTTRALTDNPELAESFTGFRVFTDNLATFPTTRFSIPAMLSGKNYDNTVPAERFIQSALADGDSAPRSLRDSGWQVGLATTIPAMLVAPADVRVAVDSYVRRRRSANALGLELLDLSAFRHAPSKLGLWVYNDDLWRLRQLSDAARKNYHAVRSQNFMTDLVAQLRVGGAAPVFRFIHVGGAHPPVVVDAACNFIGVQEISPEAYAEQVECALRQAAGLLDRLRELGLLERSAVIIASDHGVALTADASRESDPFAWVLNHAAATLMVKPFGSAGGLTFDTAPTSNQDLPTIVARLSVPGTAGDYLPPEIAPDRQRPFFFHVWQNNDWRKSYLTALHRFRVGPRAANKSAWSYLGTTPSPELSAREKQHLQEDAATYFPSEANQTSD